MKENIYNGNIIVAKDNENEWAEKLKDVTKIVGFVQVSKYIILSTPELTKISGDVFVEAGATFKAPKLTELFGRISINEDAKCEAPKLDIISGGVWMRENSSFAAPELKKIGGSVTVFENAKFTAPKLGEISGNVEFWKGVTFTAPKLKKSGPVNVVNNKAMEDYLFSKVPDSKWTITENSTDFIIEKNPQNAKYMINQEEFTRESFLGKKNKYKDGGKIPDLTKPQKGHWLYNSLDWLMNMTKF